MRSLATFLAFVFNLLLTCISEFTKHAPFFTCNLFFNFIFHRVMMLLWMLHDFIHLKIERNKWLNSINRTLLQSWNSGEDTSWCVILHHNPMQLPKVKGYIALIGLSPRWCD
jgi:hypothetical protein